ncbi:MAG TPA: hypothetical protein VHR41_05990 [Gemmatimonadales bacterium]|jgi:hypothetical protein|nr:hypothetical protein [Gemmatimonadales bacterium]
MGLYSLRQANRSVKLGVVLFLLVLGYSYLFAFLMVKTWSGLTPAKVAATYAPAAGMDEMHMATESHAATQPLDLGAVPEMQHTVDTNTLIQDSHIHIMIYAIVAALLTLIILGLDWPAWWRDTVIVVAFATGALDFAGQWLMKFGLGGFAWLTIVSGWGMSLIYLIVLYSTVRAVLPGRSTEGSS